MARAQDGRADRTSDTPNGWWQLDSLPSSLARVRDLLDPLTNLLALAAWAVGVGGLAYFVADPPSSPARWLVPVAIGLAGALVAASRFAWMTLAIGVVVLLALAIASLAKLGLEQATEDRTDAFAQAATAANAELAELPEPDDTAGSSDDEESPLGRAVRLTSLLCTRAGGEFRVVEDDLPEACQTEAAAPTGDGVDGERLLAVRKAQAEHAVAEARLALAASSDETTQEAARSTVEERSAALTAALANLEEPPEAVSFADAVASGAGAVGTDVFDAPGKTPLALSALGWLLLGLVVLGFVRALSIRNACRELGPVRLKVRGSTGGASPGENGQSVETASSAEVERFRTFLLRNIPEPGAVPGSTALTEVSNLVVALQPAVAVPFLGPIVSAVKTAVVVERGYIVEYADLAAMDAATPATSSEPRPGAGEFVVRVREARTTELLNQRIIRGDRAMALREAAYWAAAVIINASRVVPSWARWDPDSASALAIYFQADDLPGDAPLQELRKAARLAPTSGLLGLRVAHAEALARCHAEAFVRTVVAVRQHPRYLAARYRLAISASLLADDPTMLDRAKPQLPRLCDDLRAVGGGTLARAISRYAQDPRSQKKPDLAVALCDFALAQRRRGRRRLWTAWVLASALRSDGRALQLAYLPFRRRRQDAKLVGKSSTYPIEMRKLINGGRIELRFGGRYRRALRMSPDEQLAKLCGYARQFESRIAGREVIWQVPYNLACFWAVAAGRSEGEVRDGMIDDAFLLLDRARLSRACTQMTPKWLRTDADLASLREDPRFAEFLGQLPQDAADTA